MTLKFRGLCSNSVRLSAAFFFCMLNALVPSQKAQAQARKLIPEHIGLVLVQGADANDSLSDHRFQFLPYEPAEDLGTGYGYSSGMLWVKFDVTNTVDQDDWLIALEDSTANLVEFFVAKDHVIYQHQTAGSYVPMTRWATQSRRGNFALNIPRGEQRTIYMGLRSFNILDPRLSIITPNEWASIQASEGVLFGLYYGAAIAFFVYNFFLYLKVRDRSFFLYCIFVAFSTATIGTLNGHADLFFSNIYIGWQNYTNMFAILSMLFAAIFCRSFLNTRKEFPRMDKAICVMMAIYIVTAFASLPPWAQYTSSFIDILTAASGVVLVSTGLISLRSGYRPAQYYLLSWTTFFLMVLVWLAGMHGFLPKNAFTSNGVLVGSGLEMILVSFGLGDRINRIGEARELAERKLDIEKSLSQMGSQVAHDVLSPLSAIESMIASTKSIPDDRRILIRGAIRRISEIADALLARTDRNHGLTYESGGGGHFDKNSYPVHLFSLAHALVNEKKMQYRAASETTFSLHCDVKAAATFVQGLPFELARVLSNLIDNSIQAKEPTRAIDVRVHLKLLNDGFIAVEIEDNGCGMSDEILAAIGTHGATFGKAHGRGIGLAHAVDTVTQHTGTLSFTSKKGVGTTAVIRLPLTATPKEATTKIYFRGKHVVIVDDDPQVVEQWRELANDQADCVYVYHSARSFLDELPRLSSVLPASRTTAIFDLEFSGEDDNGLTLCEAAPKSWDRVVVSSTINHLKLQKDSQRLGIRYMAKCQMNFSSLGDYRSNQGDLPEDDKMTTPKLSRKSLDQTYHAALLDDNPWVCAAWTMFASENGIKIFTSTDIESFVEESTLFPRDLPIFIDVMYGDKDAGYDLIRSFIANGHTEIYGASSDFDERKIDAPSFKGNTGKTPPFWLAHRQQKMRTP